MDQSNPFEIVKNITNPLIICAHYHMQTSLEEKGKRIINPGAVGVPLWADTTISIHKKNPEKPQTQYLLLESTTTGLKTEFVSLNYAYHIVLEELLEEKINIHAPGWYIITKHLIETGELSHGAAMSQVMQLCREDSGVCNWPDIPEKYWIQFTEKFM